MRILFLFFLIISFSSCEFIKDRFGGKEKPVARVFDEYLYPSDLKGLVPKGVSAKDSAMMIQSYIENWTRQVIILKQAESNAEIDKEGIEEQLENYRQSLIIYSYEQQLVAQKLDTSVTEREIRAYYNVNKQNFELKKSIVKAAYIKLPKNAHRIDMAKKWFSSSKPNDREELETYCMQFSPEYNLSDTTWAYLDELSNIIPLSRFSETSILQKNNYIQFNDDDFVYLVKIRDYMYKEDFSPLEMEWDNVKNIIINKRKVELIENMENSVYKSALDNKDIELYNEE